MKHIIVLIGILFLNGCVQPEENIETNSQAHWNKTNKCIKKVKVCKLVEVCNANYDPDKCKFCLDYPDCCNPNKNYCDKFLLIKKCKWKHKLVKCQKKTNDASVNSDTFNDLNSKDVLELDSSGSQNVKLVPRHNLTPRKINLPHMEADSSLTADSDVITSLDSSVSEDNDHYVVAGGCAVLRESTKMSEGSLFTILIVYGLILGSMFSFLRKRLNIKGKKYVVGLIILAIYSFSSGMALSLPTNNLNPVTGTEDFIKTRSPKITLPNVSMFYHYDYRPLRVINKNSNQQERILNERHNLHLLVGLPLGDRFESGIGLPLVLSQDSGNTDLFPEYDTNTGLGDLSLYLKLRALTYKDFNLGLLLSGTLPTSTTSLLGEASSSVEFTGLISQSIGPVDLVLNAGFKLRKKQPFLGENVNSLSLGQLFTSSAAARWNIVSVQNSGLSLVSDLHTQIDLSKGNLSEQEVPVEWLNALQANLDNKVSIFTGFGIAATSGVGAPQHRILIGLRWIWSPGKTVTKIVEKTNYVEKIKVVKEKEIEVVQKFVPVMVQFPEIFFETNKATLNSRGKSKLDSVIRNLYEVAGITKIRIEGHADYRSSKKYNYNLALKRARAVRKYLLDNGVKTELETYSLGELAPLDKKDLSKNRRVDLRVINE